MKKTLSIQLWNVRDHMKDAEMTAATFKALASYGFTGIQTYSAPGNPEQFAAIAKDAGLEIIGTHTELDVLKNIDNAIAMHKTLGTTNAGLGNMPNMWSFKLTPAEIVQIIDDMNKTAEAFAKAGLRLTYHHHAFEFAKIDGNKSIMDLMFEELDPKNTAFVLDTYWLQMGGQDILEWIDKCAGRLDILHLKDHTIPFNTNGAQVTELGAGNLNFKKIVAAAEKAGVTDLCYEQDGNFVVDALDSAKRSAEYFYKHLV